MRKTFNGHNKKTFSLSSRTVVVQQGHVSSLVPVTPLTIIRLFSRRNYLLSSIYCAFNKKRQETNVNTLQLDDIQETSTPVHVMRHRCVVHRSCMTERVDFCRAVCRCAERQREQTSEREQWGVQPQSGRRGLVKRKQPGAEVSATQPEEEEQLSRQRGAHTSHVTCHLIESRDLLIIYLNKKLYFF